MPRANLSDHLRTARRCFDLDCLAVVLGRIHIGQDQAGGIEPAPCAFLDDVQPESFECVGDFSHASREPRGNCSAGAAAVHSCKRLQAAAGLGTMICARERTRAQSTNEPRLRQMWKIAGENKIPGGAGVPQRSHNSCQRPCSGLLRHPARGRLIENLLESQRPISPVRHNQRNARDQRLNETSHTHI